MRCVSLWSSGVEKDELSWMRRELRGLRVTSSLRMED